jgi:hypothetical protein
MNDAYQLQFYRSKGYNRTLDGLLSRNLDISSAQAKQLLQEHGVFIARAGVPSAEMELVRAYLGRFDAGRRREAHPTLSKADPNALLLWEAELEGHYFMAPLLRLVIGSPIYEWMAAIIDANEVAIPLSHTVLRGSSDAIAYDYFGLHQDYHVVNPAVPNNLWIALEDTAPGEKAGLAFWTQPMLETPPRADLIARCSAQPEALWFPSFEPGDVALFNYRTPHMTTGYGTGGLRWSIELRYMTVDAIPTQMQAEPFVIVRGAKRGFDLGRIEFRNLPTALEDYLVETGCRLPPLR